RRRNKNSISSGTHTSESVTEELQEFLLSTISRSQGVSTTLNRVDSELSDNPSSPLTPSTRAVFDVVKSVHKDIQAKKNASVAHISEVIRSITEEDQVQAADTSASREGINPTQNIWEIIRAMETNAKKVVEVKKEIEESEVSDQQ